MVQAVSVVGDGHRAAGNLAAAIKSYEDSLSILAASGHDEGSAAARTRGHLADSHLEDSQPERALAVVEGMLSYARNVHISEHNAAMGCLERTVAALAARGHAARAAPAAQAMLEVRRH